MRVIITGDVHGNTAFLNHVVNQAHKHGITKVVVCGDFGLWTHYEGGVRFIDTVNDNCRERGVQVYAIGGNHENWPHWNWFVENMPQDKYGFAMLRSHVLLAPRVHSWRWTSKRFLSVGGAVSVDRDYRTPGQSWWPEEQITDEEVDFAIKTNPARPDYLITHDCSNRTPFRDRLKPDLDSQIHRQRIDRVIDALVPKMHFHGHMHTWYDWHNWAGGSEWVQTYGLECDGMQESWGILDLDENKFTPNTDIR